MEKKKKTRQGMDPLVTVFLIIVLAVALTYVIPAGQFAESADGAGNAVIDMETFAFVESSPVSVASIPSQITKAFSKSIGIIVLIAAGSGAFEVIRKTGTIDAIIGLTLEKTKGNGKRAMWIVSLIFTLLSCAVIPHVFIPFTPMCIALAMALGYDDFTGTCLILLSTVVGAIGAPIAPGTAAAQSMLGLPAYSGVQYRFAIMLIYYCVTMFYLIRYAEQVKKDPAKSVVANMSEDRRALINNFEVTNYPKVTAGHAIIMMIMVASFALMIFGGYRYNWGNYDIAAVFLVMGIVSGLIGKLNINNISKYFVSGVKALTSTYMIIGMATSVTSILSSGNIINTIIYYLCKGFGKWPVLLAPVGIMIAIAIINLFVPSLNGKMPLVLPILGPVCKVLGINQQLLSVAYTFGDSFTNFVLPYNSGLVGFLEAGHATFGQWFKFFKGLLLVWVVLGGVILVLLKLIGIGPF